MPPGSTEELAGLDALELRPAREEPRPARSGRRPGPSSGRSASASVLWQLVVWSGWKPDVRPARPGRRCCRRSGELLADGTLGEAVLRSPCGGPSSASRVAIVIGVIVGSLVSPRSRCCAPAFGSLITGLQTMPSIAWFPLAILLFQLTETAILFVVVLGAAPSIANGLIAGVDQVPPLLAAGRPGARRPGLHRLPRTSSCPAVAARRSWPG